MKVKEEIATMRRMSEILCPYSYPNRPLQDEVDIYPLKTTSMMIDGYELTVHFNIAEYGKFNIEILQIESNRSTFLPMFLLLKIGRLFLGSKELCYIDFIRNGKKVYCWTIRKKANKALPPLGAVEEYIFEGFSFYVVKLEGLA